MKLRIIMLNLLKLLHCHSSPSSASSHSLLNKHGLCVLAYLCIFADNISPELPEILQLDLLSVLIPNTLPVIW